MRPEIGLCKTRYTFSISTAKFFEQYVASRPPGFYVYYSPTNIADSLDLLVYIIVAVLHHGSSPAFHMPLLESSTALRPCSCAEHHYLAPQPPAAPPPRPVATCSPPRWPPSQPVSNRTAAYVRSGYRHDGCPPAQTHRNRRLSPQRGENPSLDSRNFSLLCEPA